MGVFFIEDWFDNLLLVGCYVVIDCKNFDFNILDEKK